MTRAKSNTYARGGREFDRAAYERRLKAAGLVDEMAEDIDEFRLDLARRIAMFVNEWHGCPEALCQRHRGCMAPNIHCTNVPPSSQEEIDAEWPRVKAEIHFALEKHLANHAAEVAAIEAQEAAKAKAKWAAFDAAKARDKRGSGV
jgi:hypothetical protein